MGRKSTPRTGLGGVRGMRVISSAGWEGVQVSCQSSRQTLGKHNLQLDFDSFQFFMRNAFTCTMQNILSVLRM